MLPRVLVFLALCSGSAATAFAADPLDEVRRSFTIGGKPIPLGSGSFNGPETMSYEFRGATANGMLVFLAAWSGGGSGTFYYLHILDAASNRAFDEDGSTYSRVDLTLVRTYILGDRWQGDVSISGNSVRVVTDSSLGGHGVASVTIDARKP